jgi:hypothetical protein
LIHKLPNMRSGILRTTLRNLGKRPKVMRSAIYAGILLLGSPLASKAQTNTPPSFVNSSPSTVQACGGVIRNIDTILAVIDPNVGQTETWFEASAPNQGGTLSLSTSTPITAIVDGSSPSVVPSGITYSPSLTLSITGGTESFTIGVDDGQGGIAYIAINATIIPGPAITIDSIPGVCAGSGMGSIVFSHVTNIGANDTTLSFTGVGQAWTVPAFVTSVNFDAYGASGGSDNFASTHTPGKGGRIQGRLNVIPGEVLNIFVGGKGIDASSLGAAGGFNGGGSASYYSTVGSGGAGGGASDIRRGGPALSNRVIVAGAGGGSGSDISNIPFAGGDGGGYTGSNSANNLNGSHASGGTLSAGGAGATYPPTWLPGSNGALGQGGDGSTQGVSGGGGGGYYGGGGGVWTGGGGGSSFANPINTSSVVTTPGVQTGNGMVILSYSIPGNYSITWDATASAAGFRDTTGTMPSDSAISFAVPTDIMPTIATTYTGSLSINNGSCTSITYPINVTIKPVPSVIVSSALLSGSDVTVCNGDSTADILFINPAIGATTIKNFWTNDNTAINLPGSGEGKIQKFLPENLTSAPNIANVTVTPVADGCAGTPQNFRIVDNPIPQLLSTTSPSSICDSTIFFYAPNSATTGTLYAWSRALVPGISNNAGSGTGNISEILNNTTTDPIVVPYEVILTASGCSDTATVSVLVNSRPKLTSTLTPPAICDSTMFNYLATTGTASAVVRWSRSLIPGISNPAVVDSGNIHEVLHNTTAAPVTVDYDYSVDINSCINHQIVSVVVNPTPKLTSGTTITSVCDNSVLTYIQSSTVPGTSYAWNRDVVTGISTAANHGTGSISEVLHNATPLAVNVIYTDTLRAYGCQNIYTLTATIKAKPKLNTTLTPAAICTNNLFEYMPGTSTPGTTIQWARDQVYGISNGANTGFNNISELLIDTVATPITVPYRYVLTAAGCVDSETVNAVVNPSPKLISTTTSVCDSQVVNFIPSSATSGTTYAWSRAFASGIAQLPNTGTNSPNEVLYNTTNVDVNAIYVYTLTANSCVNVQEVTATVHPLPKLSSSLSRTACTGNVFSYIPASNTSGVNYTWSRAAVAGITNGNATGAGTINEALTLANPSAGSVNTLYKYTLTIAGCSNTQNVTVTVSPGPGAPAITTDNAINTACGYSMYTNFSAASAPAAGIHYAWSASNATVWATGSTGQNVLINFNHPGTTAVITLNATQAGTSCVSSTTYSVEVGNTAAGAAADIIYFNGQFIYRDANVSSYQWGYDDKSTLASTTLTGETNQNYANVAPDFNTKNYWVKTTVNGCTQKAYYRAPAGVEDMATVSDIKVYPNPTDNVVNVELSSSIDGNVDVQLVNIVGQTISTVTAEQHKAKISVAGLPSGCYIIECVRDGVKVATARIIKN